MANELERTIREIEATLVEERKVLLRGELQRLAEIAGRKTTLAKKCREIAGLNTPAVRSIREKAAQNHVLLEAALEGIHAAARRVAMLRHVRGSLETYDRAGRKNNLPVAGKSSVEKRA